MVKHSKNTEITVKRVVRKNYFNKIKIVGKRRIITNFNKFKKISKLLKNRPFKRIKSASKMKSKKPYKKRRAKKKTPAQLLARLEYLKATQPPALSLNLDFYKSADGVYSSYWVGKFINTLQKCGKKKTATKHVYKALHLFKFSTNTSPLLAYLELLDKIKPILRLRNYIVRRVVIKEFPIAVLRPRRLILAVHWLKEEIQAQSNRFTTSLSNEIFDKLMDFKTNPKKNNLIKKRNEFTQRTIKAQFNIRYNFRR